jgi:hypothetical protein
MWKNTISQDHWKAYELVECMVKMMKWGCVKIIIIMVRFGAFVELTSLSCIVFTIFLIVWPWTWTTNLNLTWCYNNNEIGRSKNVASCVWAMNSFVPGCNIINYGKFNDFLALRYFIICCVICGNVY